MNTYIILDLQNLFHRVKFSTKAPDTETQLSLALHICFMSVKKIWNEFGGTHLVACLEGRSWRKDLYPKYKANRTATRDARTPQQIEDDKAFFETIDDFSTFLKNHTNVSVLHAKNAEADDFIARWIQLHPEDQHVIISTDADFQQLLQKNVKIYNGVTGWLYSLDGVIDKDGKPAVRSNNKQLAKPDPEWLLFEKIMRGDASDNIMSAFPGIRTTKLTEAFKDRHKQGFAWNNLMLSKWTDHEGVDHRVKDRYELNKQLIDLTQQPESIKQVLDTTIIETIQKTPKKQVGIALLQFCNRHGLVRIEKSVGDFSHCFSAGYQGQLKNLEKVNAS